VPRSAPALTFQCPNAIPDELPKCCARDAFERTRIHATHEYTSALTTRTRAHTLVVRAEINRPQSLLKERRTLFKNCQFKLNRTLNSTPLDSKEHRSSSNFIDLSALKSAFPRWKRCCVTII